MPFNEKLAERVRTQLDQMDIPPVSERKMFGGLAFLVDEKMCINISGDRLMCRFDANDTDKLSKRRGYLPVEMKGRNLKGYCYVEAEGLKSKSDFNFWIQLCLEFNHKAKSSKKK